MAIFDPRQHDDPIWYDRVEPDEPPGPILQGLALSFLLLKAGLEVAVSLFWLPTTLWCGVSGWIATARRS